MWNCEIEMWNFDFDNTSHLQSSFQAWSVLINQFVPPTFCLHFAFTGINFRGMLHHVCDVPMTKTWVDQSELVNVGAQID